MSRTATHLRFLVPAILAAAGLLRSGTAAAQFSLTATGGTASATYTSLLATFNAINAGTHTGAITISVTGNSTETAMCVLNPSGVTVGSTTASYTSVLIKPAPGVTPSISGSIAGPSAALIKLYGADNVTIDGSNTPNGTTQDLFINNTYSSSSTNAVVWLTPYAAGDGATGNTVKNCKVYGYLGNYYMIYAAIASSGSAINNVPAAANSGNTYRNNLIGYAQYGLLDVGYNAASYDSAVVIAGNQVTGITYRGIGLLNQTAATVSGNTITAVTTLNNLSTSGIYVSSACVGGAIFNNRISDVKNPNTGGYGAAGIYLNASTAANNLLVYNNFISDVASYSNNANPAPTTTGYGMVINAGSGYRVYHNSVNMTTNQTVATGVSAAMYVGNTASGLDIRDNLFINNQSAGTRYGMYSAVGNGAYSYLDNNDYYSAGSLGYLGGAIGTIAGWRTATAKDAASFSAAPVFASTNDLHLAYSGNAAINNKGVFLGVDTMDIDGQSRSRIAPDPGADEFGPDPLPLRIVRFEAARDGARTRLEWSLAQPEGDRLQLLRSSGSGPFEPILDDEAASGRSVRYDARPLPGVNLYQLSILHPDGSRTFSGIARIDNSPAAGAITVGPNPARDQLRISGAFERATILSMTGALLHQGGYSPSIDIAALPAGMYLLRLLGSSGEPLWEGRVVKE